MIRKESIAKVMPAKHYIFHENCHEKFFSLAAENILLNFNPISFGAEEVKY